MTNFLTLHHLHLQKYAMDLLFRKKESANTLHILKSPSPIFMDVINVFFLTFLL